MIKYAQKVALYGKQLAEQMEPDIQRTILEIKITAVYKAIKDDNFKAIHKQTTELRAIIGVSKRRMEGK
jgi:hypothetical protein